MLKQTPLRATEDLKKLTANYYYKLQKIENDPNKKIAWCSSVGPAEILLAAGFEVYYPENHSAMLGARREANNYIPFANAQGYAPEICSYLTSDIGAYLKQETPFSKAYNLKKVPRPDVLVYNTNQCRDIQDWFAFYAREFNVPLLGIQSPKMIEKLNQEQISYVEGQLKRLSEDIVKITDNSFEISELRKILELSLQTSILWEEILNTSKNHPAPFSFFDGCIHMFPAVVLRGKPEANEYYTKLKEELEERVEKGIGAVENEKIRVYWEGMPIWGKLRALSEIFSQTKACVVASTYCNSWIFSNFDPNNPFSSMAKVYTSLFINRAEEQKLEYLSILGEEFTIDGYLFHNARTCPYNSNTRYGMPKRLEKLTKKPFLTIDADLNDLNVYSEEQTKTNIEAFIEQLVGY